MVAGKAARRHKELWGKPKERGKEGRKPAAGAKIVELAFWGTIVWGIIRLLAHFLNLTPYGLGAFARPLLTGFEEDSLTGVALGAIVLFVETVLASFLFSLLFGQMRAWWTGLLYGAILLAIAGFFFRIGNWEVGTLSTEGAWYLSYGLFIGMTLVLEHSDEEQWHGVKR
ncbi:YqhR family membrane protein [Brevibacillus agri]|uniref:YqhR family membrane protein n=2 Tax=Brevibacillus TaxID=55080 RepID=UPI001EE5521E|nr:YqhR family membrane protein [Brevibacillus agri]MCG5249861.1 YqhR family membrane protein [Brevibacillus agri]